MWRQQDKQRPDAAEEQDADYNPLDRLHRLGLYALILLNQSAEASLRFTRTEAAQASGSAKVKRQRVRHIASGRSPGNQRGQQNKRDTDI